MFAGGNGDLAFLAKLQAEDVLGVLGDARCIAMPPFGENLEGVGDLPVFRWVADGVNAGFLGDLATSRGDQFLVSLAATGNRLPVAWLVGK